MLAEAVLQFREWAAGRSSESALFRETNSLSPEQRRIIAAEAAAIEERLAEIRDGLGLFERERDAASDIAARCSLLWESLCELDTKHLRGYGEVPPELSAYLDPHVEDLIAHLDCIGATARSTGAGPGLSTHQPAP